MPPWIHRVVSPPYVRNISYALPPPPCASVILPIIRWMTNHSNEICKTLGAFRKISKNQVSLLPSLFFYIIPCIDFLSFLRLFLCKSLYNFTRYHGAFLIPLSHVAILFSSLFFGCHLISFAILSYITCTFHNFYPIIGCGLDAMFSQIVSLLFNR